MKRDDLICVEVLFEFLRVLGLHRSEACCETGPRNQSADSVACFRRRCQSLSESCLYQRLHGRNKISIETSTSIPAPRNQNSGRTNTCDLRKILENPGRGEVGFGSIVSATCSHTELAACICRMEFEPQCNSE